VGTSFLMADARTTHLAIESVALAPLALHGE
jgi:hypothetical protein